MIEFTVVEKYRNNHSYSIRPQLSGKNIAWYGREDDQYKLFLYDGSKTIEIYSVDIDTESSIGFAIPLFKVSEDYVVWSGADSDGKQQIFTYNGQSTIQLTNNRKNGKPFLFPQISGNNVVWNSNVTYLFENVIFSSDIFLHNGTDIIKLTNGERVDAPPKLSEDNVVWSGFDSSNRKQIFFYDGKKVTQLTENKDINNFSLQAKSTIKKKSWQSTALTQDSKKLLSHRVRTIELARLHNPIFGDNVSNENRSKQDDYAPQISGKNIAWEAKGNLFLYNGKKTIQIDDKDREVNGFSLKMSNDNVVWTANDSDGSAEVFLYNGKKTIQLTSDSVNNISLEVSGKNVVWQGIDSEGNSEIFFYDGKETIQLTDNDISDKLPQISGDYIVWQSDFDLFAYDGSRVIHLAKSIGGGVLHFHPKIDGNRIVWQRINLVDSTTSVMMATLDRPQSSFTPSVDRPSQTITTSAIAIFGLVFIYLLKKLTAHKVLH